MKHVFRMLVLGGFMLNFFGCSCARDAVIPAKNQETLVDIRWNRDIHNPIITGGSVITDVCDPSVIYDNGIWRLWASASTGDGKAYVCYSESKDGSAWDVPYIQFSPSAAGWDDQKVEIPTVIKDESENDISKRYKMWYGGASKDNPDLTKIGYAYSKDGKTWTRGDKNAGLVIGLSNANVYSDPMVVKVDDSYHVWFNSFSETEANILQINYASSDDGEEWVFHKGGPALSPNQPWEKGSHIPDDVNDVVHPTVLWNGDKKIFMMFYGSFDNSGLETYSGIGYAESTDGIDWVKDIDNPRYCANVSSLGEKYGISTGPSVVYANGKYHLFYSSVDETYSRVICHAIAE